MDAGCAWADDTPTPVSRQTPARTPNRMHFPVRRTAGPLISTWSRLQTTMEIQNRRDPPHIGPGKIPAIGGRCTAPSGQGGGTAVLGPKFIDQRAHPFNQGLEFGPHHARMHAPVEQPLRKSTIGTSDNVFVADQLNWAGRCARSRARDVRPRW
jgi:hypothetical protein